MKIAILSDLFLPRRGGIEWQMLNLARQLQKEHTVHIITAIPGPDEADGIPVHRLIGPLLPGIELAWHPRTFRALSTPRKTTIRYCPYPCQCNHPDKLYRWLYQPNIGHPDRAHLSFPARENAVCGGFGWLAPSD